MSQTNHACIRSQQRCIPPFVDKLLDEFGEESYSGNGYIRTYFSHKSIKKMEKSYGHQPVCLFQRYFGAYRVESVADGTVITKGWMTKPIRRS